MRYKEKECRCWLPYPNEMHKKRNGEWKCVDQYKNEKCIDADGWKHKTRCVLIESEG